MSNDELAKLLVEEAEKGEAWALQALVNRLWPVTNKLDLSGDVGLEHARKLAPPKEWRDKVRQLLSEEDAVGAGSTTQIQ